MKPESTFRRRLRNLALTPKSHVGELLARLAWVRTSYIDAAYQAVHLIPEHCDALIPILREQVISNGVASLGPGGLLERIVEAVSTEQRDRFLQQNAEMVRLFARRVPTNGMSPVSACLLALVFAKDRPEDTYALLRWFKQNRGIADESPEIQALDPDHSLRWLLSLEFGDADDRTEAARALEKLRTFPEKAVPLLIANLRWPDTEVLVASAKALAAHAAAAESAVPALTNLLTHADASVVIAALDAIRLIEMAQSVRANIP
jgi:hypothetical protein